jgi:hypothetical protein
VNETDALLQRYLKEREEKNLDGVNIDGYADEINPVSR